jgi:hypothetical protein
MRSPRRWIIPLSLALLIASRIVFAQDAAPLSVGDAVPGFELKDQFDETHAVDVATRVVLFSRDMGGGDLLKQTVASLPEGFLAEHGAVYIANISGMPRIISKLFAMRKMRKRPYPLLLDRTGEATAWIPDVEGKATLVFLDALRITRVSHHASVSAVRGELIRGADERVDAKADPKADRRTDAKAGRTAD